jgi:hypothetical protein
MLTVELPASAMHEMPVRVIVEPVSLRQVHWMYVPVAIVLTPSPRPGWQLPLRVPTVGSPKLRTAAEEVPLLVTVGVAPGARGVTVQPRWSQRYQDRL